MVKNNFSNALLMFFLRVFRKVGQWNLHLFFLVLPEEDRAVKSTFAFPWFSRSIYVQALTNFVFHRREGRGSGAEAGEMFRVSPALGISIIHPWQPCSLFSIIHSFFVFFPADCEQWRIGCQDRWIDYHLSVHAQKGTDVICHFTDTLRGPQTKQVGGLQPTKTTHASARKLPHLPPRAPLR